MTPPRDPDEVDQTLVPDAPAETPRGGARPLESAASSDTPPHPGAAEATIDTPVTPVPAAVDSGETLPMGTHPTGLPLPRTRETASETHPDTEATLLPSAPAPSGAHATIGGSDATGAESVTGDATLPTPAGRTVASGGSSGPLGSDTVPTSYPAGPGTSPSATGTMVGRFALQDLHASGGLGEVFKARDTELNREVAVKRIKSHYADDPGSRRRFLTEAELTAKLDHPGVVPVFGLVNDVRGRPCYAMRFIRGETLKDEIDRYHAARKAEKAEKPEEKKSAAPVPDAVPRSVAFRHLLARFIATCQAIAYAHSRNIIHRDIKPANIMVGAFGETLVVDWGLAKSLDDGPDFDRMMKAAAAAGFRHDPDATDMPSHMTLAGTAVGTPAYMAPEQAAGEIDKVGARADVYALGATLYVILVGRAPFGGKTTAEVLDLVRRGAYEPASVANPECPKPLDAIARKAMALRPEDRYPTALELAADVERWLSDEPVSCYPDPFFARLARWARRHPARVATSVSLLLAGTLAAAGVAWAIHEGEKRTAAERDNVIKEKEKTDAALAEVSAKKKQIEEQNGEITARNVLIQAQKDDITVARDVATGRYEKAVEAYNVLINDIDKQLADRAGMQDLRKTLLLNATVGLEKLVAGEGRTSADRTLVAAYRQMGEVYQIVGETRRAREKFELAVDRAEVVRDNVRGGATADKRAADRDLGRSLDKLAGLLYLQADDTRTAIEKSDKAVALFAALAEDPTDTDARVDLAAARERRAAILLARGETGKALPDSDAALVARKQLSEAAPNDPERARAYAASLDARAAVQLQTGHTKAALENAETAVRVRKALADRLPDLTNLVRELAGGNARLGEVNVELGQLTAARDRYREAVKGLMELVAKDGKSALAKSELAATYGQLGQVLLRTGDIEEAVTNMEAGLDLALDLQKADPDSAKARRDLALAREQHGDALLAVGRTDEAVAEYAESRKTLDRLNTADPESARANLDFARALERVGDGCLAKRDAPGARAAFEQSVKLRRGAARKDPDSATAKRELAAGLYKLAAVQGDAGQYRAAAESATEATDLFVKLAAADPDSARAKRDVARAYDRWGQVLAAGNRPTGALIVWQSALDRCADLAKDGTDVRAREDLALAWERLARYYAALGYNDGALADRALASARAALDLWTAIGDSSAKTKAGRRRLALAMIRCGDINVALRQFPAARKWYAQAGTEVAAFAADPLLGPIVKYAAEQSEYLDAVEAGLRNPAAVMTFPEGVRGAALRTIVNLELRGDPTVLGLAAKKLAEIAKTPEDMFTAARAYANCAAALRGSEEAKNDYAAEAVVQLNRAIEAHFHDAEALAGSEWDAVSRRCKDFAKAKEKLEKQRDEEK